MFMRSHVTFEGVDSNIIGVHIRYTGTCPCDVIQPSLQREPGLKISSIICV